MNKVQIMSTNPQAGSVKADASSPKSLSSAKTAAKSSGFDDVLQKSQAQTDSKAAVQGKDAKDVARGTNDVAEAAKNAAQDAKEAKDAKDAAAVAEVTAKTPAKGASKSAEKNGKVAGTATVAEDTKEVLDDAAAANVASAILATKLTAVQTMLAGEMKNLAKDIIGTKGAAANAVEDLAQALLDASSQKATASTSLLSILPQNATAGKAQQAMLALLSGQNPATQDAQTALASLLAKDANPTPSIEALQNLMAVAEQAQTPQANTMANTNPQATANAQDANAFAALQSLVTPAAQQTVAQAQPLFANLQTSQVTQPAQVQQPQGEKANLSDFANLLGTDIQTAPGNDLGQQALSTFSQQSGANPDGGQQSAQQQAALETLMTQDGEQTVTQLPEEAAFDKAPATAQEAAPTQTAGITSFAQTLQQAGGTTQAAAPQAAQQPATDYNIPQQIVDQARLIQRGQETEMVIHLKPEHLGDLTLRVSVGADGAVNASFHSNNAEVRTIIENTLVQLRQDLNDQGIKVDNVGVYAGLADGGLPQDSGQQQAFQQSGQGRQHSAQESAEAFEDGQELAAALAAQKENATTDGVDYRV